jgi:hypothetical protein
VCFGDPINGLARQGDGSQHDEDRGTSCCSRPGKISERSLLGRQAFLIERERGRRLLLPDRSAHRFAKCRSVINCRRVMAPPSGPGG